MRKIPYRKIFWSKVGTKRKLNYLEKAFYVVAYRRFPFKSKIRM